MKFKKLIVNGEEVSYDSLPAEVKEQLRILSGKGEKVLDDGTRIKWDFTKKFKSRSVKELFGNKFWLIIFAIIVLVILINLIM